MLPPVNPSMKQQLDRFVVGVMKGDDMALRKANEIIELFRTHVPELPMSIRSVQSCCNNGADVSEHRSILSYWTEIAFAEDFTYLAAQDQFQRTEIAAQPRWPVPVRKL
ncbi:hypothetical protein Smp_168280 [Schistosoma mansoni]|uniref:hypothetical protein n=1 Tax=Schistosoma mansoni TaxID=6183 RepID=UPI0001A61BA9|nr:hypothetical protein Smp_168280 [Schistosoma mansoni]|eukprot:XP_018647495.1 hypothetical protein Smp_168280 [Schistosoma mansoni]